MQYLALDIGGTKIEICRVVDIDNIQALERLATSRFKTGRIEFLSELIDLISTFLDPRDAAICISFNCLVKNNVLLASSLLGSENIDFASVLRETIDKPCHVENDVVCQALSERYFGFGKRTENFVLVNIGTGLRVVPVIDGNIILGHKNVAGEIEDLFVTKVSGNTIARCLSGNGISKIYQALSGRYASSYEILQRKDYDHDARRATEIFIKKLNYLFIMLSKFYNPEIMVLNGSIGKSLVKYFPEFLAKYRIECPNYFQFQELVISGIEHAACLGAVLAYINRKNRFC